jgi:hypothetical protein
VPQQARTGPHNRGGRGGASRLQPLSLGSDGGGLGGGDEGAGEAAVSDGVLPAVRGVHAEAGGRQALGRDLRTGSFKFAQVGPFFFGCPVRSSLIFADSLPAAKRATA